MKDNRRFVQVGLGARSEMDSTTLVEHPSNGQA